MRYKCIKKMTFYFASLIRTLCQYDNNSTLYTPNLSVLNRKNKFLYSKQAKEKRQMLLPIFYVKQLLPRKAFRCSHTVQ